MSLSEVTKGKTSAECGYTAPAPADLVPALQLKIGLIEGLLYELTHDLHELKRRLEDES